MGRGGSPELRGRRGGVAVPLDFGWLPLVVAGPLGFVWPPWGSGGSPGVCVAAVGEWRVLWASFRRHGVSQIPCPRVTAVGVWPVPWASSARRRGVAGSLGFVWPTWGRSRSPRFVWLPLERGQSPGLCLAAVGAWRVPWASSGPLGAWLVTWTSSGRRGGRGRSPGFVWPP